MTVVEVQELSWHGQVMVMGVLAGILVVGGLLLHYLRQLPNKNALLTAILVIVSGCFGGISFLHNYQPPLFSQLQAFFMAGCIAEVFLGWVFYCQKLQPKEMATTSSSAQSGLVPPKKDSAATLGEVMLRLHITDQIVGSVIVNGQQRVNPQIVTSYAALRQSLLEGIQSVFRADPGSVHAQAAVSPASISVLEQMEEVALVAEVYERTRQSSSVSTRYQN